MGRGWRFVPVKYQSVQLDGVGDCINGRRCEAEKRRNEQLGEGRTFVSALKGKSIVYEIK